MTQQPDYKTLPGGSIDYAHYIRKSHEARSLAAHGALRRLCRALIAVFAARGKARDPGAGAAPVAAE